MQAVLQIDYSNLDMERMRYMKITDKLAEKQTKSVCMVPNPGKSRRHSKLLEAIEENDIWGTGGDRHKMETKQIRYHR